LCETDSILRDAPGMTIRYYIDPDTSAPHIHAHSVGVQEMDVLRKPLEEVRGRKNMMIAIGRTRSGRDLRVIYVPDDDGEGIFVITAYNLPARQKRALRRRLRGRSP
jgi:hypothetical protein